MSAPNSRSNFLTAEHMIPAFVTRVEQHLATFHCHPLLFFQLITSASSRNIFKFTPTLFPTTLLIYLLFFFTFSFFLIVFFCCSIYFFSTSPLDGMQYTRPRRNNVRKSILENMKISHLRISENR